MKKLIIYLFVFFFSAILSQNAKSQSVYSNYFEREQYIFLDTDWGNSFDFKLEYCDTRLWTKSGWASEVSDVIITSKFKKWMHLVLVYDAELGIIKILINNDLVKIDTTWPGIGANVGLHSKFEIGNYLNYDGSRSSFFKGDLDEIRVYNRALSDIEIKDLYNNSLSNSLDDGLYLYYPFNGNTSDESGKVNHGVSDTETFSVDRFGNANSALSFDGIDDYLESTTPLPDMPSMTISTWIYINDTFPSIIRVNEKSIGFSASGKNEELISYKSNIDININSTADWLSFRDTSSWYGDSFILINTQPNIADISREATISISAPGVETQYVTVIQEGVLIWKSYSTNDGLIDNNVNCIAIDSKNNKWFGTERGISKFDGIKWTNYQMIDGLVSDNITCIAIDKEDRVWVGTDKGISFFDGSIWISNEFSEKSINSIVISKNDEVLFAAENEIFRNKGNWEKLAYNLEGWVMKIFSANFNNLWILDEQGIYLYNLENDTFTIINVNPLGYHHIGSIYSSSDSTVWFGYYQGEHMVGSDYYQGFLAITMLKGAEVFNYPLYFYGQSQGITSITEDLNQIMWFAAYGWVWKYNGQFWMRYTNSDGLINNWKINIAIDAYNNKWFGTDSGVSVLVENQAGLYATINSIENANKLNVFPNPTTTRIQFTSPVALSQPAQLQIFDYTGRQILSQTLSPTQQGETVTIDLSTQPAGIYLVRLNTGKEEFSGKILLVK